MQSPSLHSSLNHAENQLLGALLCMLDSQKIAKARIDNELPVLPLGFANVGNWVSFWLGDQRILS